MAVVSETDIDEINLEPEDEEEDVAQCLGMILKSYKNSIPFMRGFGIDSAHYGRPMVGNENDIVDEAYEQIEKFESRAEIEDIEVEEDQFEGSAEITVEYRLANEDEEDEEDE